MFFYYVLLCSIMQSLSTMLMRKSPVNRTAVFLTLLIKPRYHSKAIKALNVIPLLVVPFLKGQGKIKQWFDSV